MEKYLNIIEHLKTNDPASMELLYENYGRYFYSYCVNKWGCDEDAAWEIVYRTLETLVLKLHHYDFESQIKFDAFLYRVLLNFIRQEYRSARVRHGIALKSVDFNYESLPKAIDQQITQAALEEYYAEEKMENSAIRLLNQVLLTMDSEDRDLLLLRAQNYSYEEISQLLGTGEENLKMKYHRAKKKLIRLLTDEQKGKDHANN